ncbi:MAG: class I SAM-dependent methyltransferase [Methanoregula sp.]|nr:class I SAM-dependent methyltransferase [Methanoregula sp.]
MNPEPACTCDPDWNAIWMARQERHASSKHFDDPSHNWDKPENAARYEKNSSSRYDARIQLTIRSLDITPDSRVLDIGAGPGTLALPLSPLVREISAVEPGEGMVGILESHIHKDGITNISCIKKRWEEVEIEHDLDGNYDVVIASLSLTMHDIRAALAKMDQASTKYVYLFWFVNSPFWEKMYDDLWEPLHGVPYFPGPKADCLFNVLYQMGIYANVEMLPLEKEYRFASVEEMTAFFRGRFSVTTPEQEKVLGKYLTPLIRHDGNEIVISGDSTFAKIWWKKPVTGKKN